jgi:hypothetical protein
MEPRVTPLPVQGDDLRRCGQRLGPLLRADDAVLLHAAEHIGKALLGALRTAVGIEEVRSLEETRQHGPLAKGERLGRFAEIAPRGHLDAP